MQSCAACAAPVRPTARFCTRCGAPVRAVPDVAAPVPAPAISSVPVAVAVAAAAPEPFPPSAPAPTPEPVRASAAAPIVVPPVVPQPETPPEPTDAAPEHLDVIPSRIPSRGRVTAPPARSASASWAFAAGTAPLVVSVTGNLVAMQLGVAALERVAAGEPQGAWAGVLVVLALVFVLNAGLLTVCAIAGARGIRETGNGLTRGRGFAIAGLAVGAVNLVLWVAGLVVSVSGLGAALT